MTITKRDGRKQEFDKERIVKAVEKAFKSVDDEITRSAKKKANDIAKYVESLDENMGVEEIQNIVEQKLMASDRKDVAKAYILYREKRNKARRTKSEFNKIIGEKLTASNVQNSNANMDEYSFGGRMGEANTELAKQYALDNLVSEKFARMHNNNILYLHDFGNAYAVGMHNCLTIPFDQLFENGFKTKQQSIRKPSSVTSALQLVAVIMQCQSLVQFGGVSASHLDWTLVPYVRKSFSRHYKTGLKYIDNCNDNTLNNVPKELSFDDSRAKANHGVYQYAYDMTVKEVYQAVEAMLHNLNSLQSRSGNQLPFSSLNYGTCTLEEGRLITRAILENTIKGGGDLNATYIFPCQIFKVKSGVNKEKGTPNYDLYRLALKSTSLRLYPNYANVDWSTNQVGNDGSLDSEMSTMGKV